MFNDQRKYNPELEAAALAKGLKRRREDKLNYTIYYSTVALLSATLLIFFIGDFLIK